MKYAAINVNVDSIGEETNFSFSGVDPAFTTASNRFLSLSRHYRLPYSFFVVGKDLNRPEHRLVVKQWSREGHEIGNHSWSHHNNLGALPPERIKKEVADTHRCITDIIGKRPRGFIAPGWSFSQELFSILNQLRYEYDCSVFPSWMMIPALVKLFINRWRDARKWSIFRRKDIALNFFGRVTPFLYQRLVELPLPVGLFRLPCYHTMGFVWGWDTQKRVLKECLRRYNCFYYLMHPVDLLDSQDIQNRFTPSIERLNVPVAEKIRRAQEMIEIILKSGRTIVTMRELANKARREL